MRIGVVVLAIWTVVNLVLSSKLARRDLAIHQSNDGRTAIALVVKQRDAVLAEMRTMLASVQGVLDGAARSDTAAIRVAASASGMAAAADPALERVLPEAFLRLGMATHVAFDTLAVRASEGAQASIGRLAALTGRCISCHATYRLEAQR